MAATQFARQSPGSLAASLTWSSSGVASGDRHWMQIFVVGGIVWLCGTVAAIMEMSSFGGTSINGTYVLTNAARSIQHLVLFGIACLGYRLAIHLGWPLGVQARLRVSLANLLIAIAVLAVTPTITDLCAGLIDGQTRSLFDAFHTPATVGEWGLQSRLFLPPYILGLCAIALIRLARGRQREALQRAELERAYAAARLSALSAQLQPHFLFNSLHAISELIEESPRRAGAAVVHLGDFLRYALESRDMLRVDLATEFEGIKAYLALQQVRFGERLEIELDISADSLVTELPPLLLQPLTENAIEHGRGDGRRSKLFIRIIAKVHDGHLVVEVQNSGACIAHELTAADFGQGLSNVATRLRAVYGDLATLRVRPDAPDRTTAAIRLPLSKGRSAREPL